MYRLHVCFSNQVSWAGQMLIGLFYWFNVYKYVMSVVVYVMKQNEEV